MFPAVLLLHGIFVRGLAPELQYINLGAALLSAPLGYAFRRLRRATAVIGVMIAFSAFTFLWMFGFAAPLAYLSHQGERESMPATALTIAIVLGIVLLWRVRVPLRGEFSKPLDQTEGIHIATQSWVIWREFGQRRSPLFNTVAIVLLILLVPVLSLSRRQPEYLVFAMRKELKRWLGNHGSGTGRLEPLGLRCLASRSAASRRDRPRAGSCAGNRPLPPLVQTALRSRCATIIATYSAGVVPLIGLAMSSVSQANASSGSTSNSWIKVTSCHATASGLGCVATLILPPGCEVGPRFAHRDRPLQPATVPAAAPGSSPA